MMGQPLSVGLICPGGGVKNPENEMGKYKPDDVTILAERIPLAKIDVEVLSRLADEADGAAVRLAERGAQVIALNCTSGSFIRGAGYDREIIERLERSCGLPVTTTTTAVTEALTTLGIRKMAMVTPYPDAVNEIEIRFMRDSGYDVLSCKGLGIVQMNLVAQVPFDRIYSTVRDAFTPACEGIFVSCAGFRVIDYIRGLESDFGRPVVTSNQATLWKLMRMMGRTEDLKAGSLFTK